MLSTENGQASRKVGGRALKQVPKEDQGHGRRTQAQEFLETLSPDRAGRDTIEEIHLWEYRPGHGPAAGRHGPKEGDPQALLSQHRPGAQHIQRHMGCQRNRPWGHKPPVHRQRKSVRSDPGEEDQGREDQDGMARLAMNLPVGYPPEDRYDIQVREAGGDPRADPQRRGVASFQEAGHRPGNPDAYDYVSDR